MADDVTLNSMSGGSVVATDDSGTGHVQIVKLAYSADGSRTHVDADTDGLKVKVSNATVTVALSGGSLPTGSNVIGAVTQSGTWNIGSITTLPSLPTGSNVIGGVTQSGTWNVGITGTPTVTVGNASIPVTDNGGSLTVDGSVAATQSGTWNVGTVTPGTDATNLGKAEDAAHSASDVGVMALAVRNDNAATTLVSADADYSSFSVDSRGAVFVKSPYRPTPYKLNSAASTNATSVSATANTLLYGYYISNTNSSVRYVKFYNKASAPTVGTDTPVLVLAIPGSGAANVSFPAGINFTTGLAFATTTGAADSDTAAVAANEVIVNLVYATY
jgi:hypothetical protein